MKLLESLKTNRRISNKKYRRMKCGIASGFAFGYDPTRRSVVLKRPFYKRLTTGRIHYSMFDVGRSMFDVH